MLRGAAKLSSSDIIPFSARDYYIPRKGAESAKMYSLYSLRGTEIVDVP
jgi:hypothetical protein